MEEGSTNFRLITGNVRKVDTTSLVPIYIQHRIGPEFIQTLSALYKPSQPESVDNRPPTQSNEKIDAVLNSVIKNARDLNQNPPPNMRYLKGAHRKTALIETINPLIDTAIEAKIKEWTTEKDGINVWALDQEQREQLWDQLAFYERTLYDLKAKRPAISEDQYYQYLNRAVNSLLKYIKNENPPSFKEDPYEVPAELLPSWGDGRPGITTGQPDPGNPTTKYSKKD